MAQTVKNLPAKQETWVQSLGREDSLEKGVATHSSILAWGIPWTDEPQATVHGITELDTTEQLKHTHTHTHIYIYFFPTFSVKYICYFFNGNILDLLMLAFDTGPVGRKRWKNCPPRRLSRRFAFEFKRPFKPGIRADNPAAGGGPALLFPGKLLH